jgi:peptidyl-prolyl cis-trans isomerase A (cyclophilin A)
MRRYVLSWLFGMVLAMGGCKDAADKPAETREETAQPTAATPKPPRVVLETTMGRIVLELDQEKAPISTANFLAYVDSEHYDGTIFHRVIDNFMIQGGGFRPDLVEVPVRNPIKNEWNNGLMNDRGTIAMARTMQPDSAAAQFYINLVDNPRLSQPISGGAGYAVFGRVVEGMDVVDRIGKVATRQVGPNENVPVEPVIIQQARRAQPSK